jgi:hypothetical protein
MTFPIFREPRNESSRKSALLTMPRRVSTMRPRAEIGQVVVRGVGRFGGLALGPTKERRARRVFGAAVAERHKSPHAKTGAAAALGLLVVLFPWPGDAQTTVEVESVPVERKRERPRRNLEVLRERAEPTAPERAPARPEPSPRRPMLNRAERQPQPLDARRPGLVQPVEPQKQEIPSAPPLHDPDKPRRPTAGTHSMPGLFDEPEEPAPDERRTHPGGCFIATAAYGTPLAAEVRLLERFRDRYLLTSPPGRFLVQRYNRHSPPIARYIAGRPMLRAAVRAALHPVIYAIKHPWAGVLVLLLLLLPAATWVARVRARRQRAGDA